MRESSIKFSGAIATVGFVGVLFVLFISAVIGAVCWTYTINSWLVFAGKPPSVLWWHGALIGFVPYVGQASIPAAVITWVAMMFLA